MEFALHLYTILDLMYTFIRSAQILNTEHQSYQMIIYSAKTSLPQSLNLLQTTCTLDCTLHYYHLLTKMKPFCLSCLCNVFLLWHLDLFALLKKQKKQLLMLLYFQIFVVLSFTEIHNCVETL